jgi:hypothetical protein
MRLGPEIPLLALPRLVHLGIALPTRVLGRTGRMNDRRIKKDNAPMNASGFSGGSFDLVFSLQGCSGRLYVA